MLRHLLGGFNLRDDWRVMIRIWFAFGTHVVSMNVMLNALDATLQLLVLRRQNDVS